MSPPSTESGLAGRHVLVVEDEYLIAGLLAEALVEQAATVVGPASSVERALALVAQADTLDMAVLDVNLRGEDVYPVADVLTARGVPFVLVTGYDRHAIPRRYRDGMVLEKPIELADVVATLRRLVD